jgi:hypothetical protein
VAAELEAIRAVPSSPEAHLKKEEGSTKLAYFRIRCVRRQGFRTEGLSI